MQRLDAEEFRVSVEQGRNPLCAGAHAFCTSTSAKSQQIKSSWHSLHMQHLLLVKGRSPLPTPRLPSWVILPHDIGAVLSEKGRKQMLNGPTSFTVMELTEPSECGLLPWAKDTIELPLMVSKKNYVLTTGVVAQCLLVLNTNKNNKKNSQIFPGIIWIEN